MQTSSRAAAMLLCLLAAASLPVGAQTPLPTEFPEGSQPFTAEALRERLTGKVFKVKPADGNEWRLDYQANGYVYLDTSRGGRDSGTWRVDGTQLCTEWKRSNAGGCNEARSKDGALYVKRSVNGEVIVLMAQ